jgi:hypothetical protein
MAIYYVKDDGSLIRISHIKKLGYTGDRYGIIVDPQTVDVIVKNNVIAIYDDLLEAYYNVIKIVGVCVISFSKRLERFYEYNPTTAVISSDGPFWVSKEVEYKIETENFVPMEQLLTRIHSKHYVFSAPVAQRSFERYYKYTDGINTEYIDILGKKGWKKPMALKHKKMLPNNPILARKMYLLPYSREKCDELVLSSFRDYESVSIHKLDPFYKVKERSICVDVNRGIVYGVSSSKAEPLTKRRRKLYQIEVEYWSRIVSDIDMIRENFEGDGIDYKGFFELINLIDGSLNIKKKSPGCRKVEWLEE